MSDTAPTPPPPPTFAPTPAGLGPVGTIRNPMMILLLTVFTCGIYGLIWTYSVFKELKTHTGEGLGGPVGLILALVSGLSGFFLPHEIGNMYQRAGLEKPMTWKLGFWHFLPFVGSIIWLWKVQGALNARWTAAASPAA